MQTSFLTEAARANRSLCFVELTLAKMHGKIKIKFSLGSSLDDLHVFTPEPRSKERNIMKKFIQSLGFFSCDVQKTQNKP